VQLPEHLLQRRFRAFADVEHDRAMHLSLELYRIGDDEQRARLVGKQNTAPLAQALLSGWRKIGNVGLLGRPYGGRDEGAAALLEQQQRSAHVGNLQALQCQPAAAEFARRLR
jgi:hypothetical protein